MINTARDEFIGEELEILNSANKPIVGMKGKIVDETRSGFKLLINDSFKVVMKKGSTFMIGGMEIEGDSIFKRPEDRIKV